MDENNPVLMVRNQPVMLASSVAQAFDVETREVNQTVARNKGFFTDQHTFLLAPEEEEFLRSHGVIPKPGRGGSRAPLRVYTQKGVIRLATIMENERAKLATDRVIDVFLEVTHQLAQGKRDVEIRNPSSLLPETEDRAAQRQSIQGQILKAVKTLSAIELDPEGGTTVGDELRQKVGGALDMLQEHLKNKGLKNERFAAETVKILEEASAIRINAQADVSKKNAESPPWGRRRSRIRAALDMGGHWVHIAQHGKPRRTPHLRLRPGPHRHPHRATDRGRAPEAG